MTQLNLNVKNTANLHTNLVLRGVAILAVVLVHLMSIFPSTMYVQEPWWGLFLGLNQWSRFSVPLFLALSGYGLARKYAEVPVRPWRLLKSRVAKLIPQYLVWSMVLIILFGLIGPWSGFSLNWWRGLLFGSTDYHLYFIPLIIEFYLLYALLLRLVSRRVLTVLLFGAVALQLALMYLIYRTAMGDFPSYYNYLMSDQMQYRLIFNWAGYFFLGLVLGRYDLTKLARTKSLAWILILVTICSLVWSTLESRQLLQQTGAELYSTGFLRLPVLVYATGVIVLSLVWGGPIISRLGSLVKPMAVVGRYSYIIYLSHTLGIRLVQHLAYPQIKVLELAVASFVGGVGLWILYKIEQHR